MSTSPEPQLSITSTNLLAGLRDSKNEEIWREYVGRYRPLLVRYGMRLGLKEVDAEDAAQLTLVTFCRAYQEGKYDRERGRLRSWLFAIAKNQILTWHRRMPDREVQFEETSSRSHILDQIGDEDKLSELWDQQWREAVLQQCMAAIRREVEEKTYRAFELFAAQGRDAESVGAELGMTANAVFSAKRRILRRLRELLPEMEAAF